jgi:hypothetical protein
MTLKNPSGDRGSIPGRGKRVFSSSLYAQMGSGTHPASNPISIGGLFLGSKGRLGHDGNHSLASSAEVKNE